MLKALFQKTFFKFISLFNTVYEVDGNYIGKIEPYWKIGVKDGNKRNRMIVKYKQNIFE